MRSSDIIESYSQDPRIFKLIGPEEDWWPAIQKNASEALRALKNKHVFFKGFRSGPDDKAVILTNPKLKVRKSANTTNYYTILFSNLPSWKSFPQRNKSLVGTTEVYTADNYGTPYIVLPFNGAKIGVCPKSDMWGTELTMCMAPATFNYYLESNHISAATYKTIITGLFEHKEDMQKYGTPVRKPQLLEQFETAIKNCKNTADIIKVLDTALAPKINGFQLKTINTMPIINTDEPHELWTDSKSYLIRIKSEFYKTHLANIYASSDYNGLYR